MLLRIRIRCFVTAATLLLATSVFAQGMYWESTTSGAMLGNKVLLSKNFTMPKKLRHEGGDGQVLIVRIDKEVLYMITPGEKTYSEIPFTELEAFMKGAGAKVNAQAAELEEKMKDMPEEQRQMIEKMMGGRMPGKKDGKVDVQGPGEKKKISGFTCAKYVASLGGKELLTAWVTKDVKGFDAMKKDWQEFGRKMAAMNPINGKAMAEAFMKMDGFAIEMDVEGITTLVTKIEPHTTAPSEFEVPAGYTKKDSPLTGMTK